MAEPWRVLVLGGCGRVGTVAAAGLLAKGHAVVLTARDESEAQARSLADLPCEVVDFSQESSARDFAARVAALRCDHAVLSFAPRSTDGPLWELQPLGLQRVLGEQVASQLRAVQVVGPTLPPRGRLLMINGSTAHRPQSGLGVRNIVAASTLMLQRCLRAEAEPEGGPVRPVSLLLEGAVGAPGVAAEHRLEDHDVVDAVETLLREARGSVYVLAPQRELRLVGSTVHEATDLEELA